MVQCSMSSRTHKFGLELPKMVQEFVATNKKNGNTLWQNAIEKKIIENVKIAFQIIPNVEKAPNGY